MCLRCGGGLTRLGRLLWRCTRALGRTSDGFLWKGCSVVQQDLLLRKITGRELLRASLLWRHGCVLLAQVNKTAPHGWLRAAPKKTLLFAPRCGKSFKSAAAEQRKESFLLSAVIPAPARAVHQTSKTLCSRTSFRLHGYSPLCWFVAS